MKLIIVLACWLAFASGIASQAYKSDIIYDPDLPPHVYSKREAAAETVQSVTTGKLYQMINATLERATQGISGEALKQAVQNIQAQARAILVASGANVSQDDIRKLVNDIVAQFGIESSAADILDDPLTAEARKLEVAIVLLYILRERGLSYEAAGESTNVTVAAIEAVCEVLELSITQTEAIITIIEANYHLDDNDNDDDGDDSDDDKTINKREASPEDSSYRSQRSRPPIKISVTIEFRRR